MLKNITLELSTWKKPLTDELDATFVRANTIWPPPEDDMRQILRITVSLSPPNMMYLNLDFFVGGGGAFTAIQDKMSVCSFSLQPVT